MEELRGSEQLCAFLKWKVPPDGLKRIALAWRQSKYAHRGQLRDEGVRYFEHPKSVAWIIVSELHIYDHEIIEAALLHDVREDSWLHEEGDIELIFGERVAYMVNALTKKKDQTLEDKLNYLDGIVSAGEEVQTIKLADRLHNLRTLHSCTPDKQKRILEETRSFFIPMAWSVNPYLAQELSENCDRIEAGLEENTTK